MTHTNITSLLEIARSEAANSLNNACKKAEGEYIEIKDTVTVPNYFQPMEYYGPGTGEENRSTDVHRLVVGGIRTTDDNFYGHQELPVDFLVHLLRFIE
jgi:hypothetical protein